MKVESNEDTSAVNAPTGPTAGNALTGQPAGNAHILLIDPSNTDYGKVPGRTLAVDHKVMKLSFI